ncbi:MAG: DUF5995 family protein [Candidatus Nanopelagicales bacterium]
MANRCEPTPGLPTPSAPVPSLPLPGVADVVARMADLSAGLPTRDGVRAFNDMYLTTTREVARALGEHRFLDREFMDRLDVNFADLYFEALAAYDCDPASAPRCWSALIAARERTGASPLQFALAGMNAHIGYDLPRALVATTLEFGGDLGHAGRRADFVTINEILASTQPIVKQALLVGLLDELDDVLGEVDDRIGVWAIEQAREVAWGSAHALWALRGTRAQRLYEQGMDRVVEFSSRGLLSL